MRTDYHALFSVATGIIIVVVGSSFENRALYDIYTKRILEADKKELPEVLLDVYEAQDLGKLDEAQVETLKSLRMLLPSSSDARSV